MTQEIRQTQLEFKCLNKKVNVLKKLLNFLRALWWVLVLYSDTYWLTNGVRINYEAVGGPSQKSEAFVQSNVQ